jgi:hypothetical protein
MRIFEAETHYVTTDVFSKDIRGDYVILGGKKIRVTKTHDSLISPDISTWLGSGYNVSIFSVFNQSIQSIILAIFETLPENIELLVSSFALKNHQLFDLIGDISHHETQAVRLYPQDLPLLLEKRNELKSGYDFHVTRIVLFLENSTCSLHVVDILTDHGLKYFNQIINHDITREDITHQILSPLIHGNCKSSLVIRGDMEYLETEESTIVEILRRYLLHSNQCNVEPKEDIYNFEFTDHHSNMISPIASKIINTENDIAHNAISQSERLLDQTEKELQLEIQLQDEKLERQRFQSAVNTPENFQHLFTAYEQTIDNLTMKIHELEDKNSQLLYAEHFVASPKLEIELSKLRRKVTGLEKEKRKYNVSSCIIDKLRDKLRTSETVLAKRSALLEGVQARSQHFNEILDEKEMEILQLRNANEVLNRMNAGLNEEVQILRNTMVMTDSKLLTKYLLPSDCGLISLNRAESMMPRIKRELTMYAPPQAITGVLKLEQQLIKCRTDLEKFQTEAIKLQTVLGKVLAKQLN